MKKRNNPEVSIIMPCYNGKDYIRKSLDSVLSQTYKDFELICVNDGSTDNTLEILKEYKKKHDNIIIIDKKNEGGLNVLSKAIKKMRGKYVCIIDNDDIVSNKYLSVLHDTIVKYNASLSVCAYERVDYLTGKVYSREMQREEKCYKVTNDPGILLEVNTSLWNKMFKRELVDSLLEFEFTSTGMQDMIYNSFMYTKVEKIAFTPEILYYYQVRQSSNINTLKTKVIDSMYDNMKRIREYYKNNCKDNMTEFYDAYAFLHLGVSFMFRTYTSHKSEYKKTFERNKKILNECFPLWKKNKYYSIKYIYENKRNFKMFICYMFYKLNLFTLFLFCYSFITKNLKFDIKW